MNFKQIIQEEQNNQSFKKLLSEKFGDIESMSNDFDDQNFISNNELYAKESFEDNQLWTFGLDASTINEALIQSNLSPKEAQQLTILIWKYLQDTGVKKIPVFFDKLKIGFAFKDIYETALEIPNYEDLDDHKFVKVISNIIWLEIKDEFIKQ